jgi:glycosyltransferase involved in cell wall biosynthesis
VEKSNHQQKKVSIIVPNYNHARFLRRRIDSIDAQTYKNTEVILLDDCSTDESEQILDEYQHHHAHRTKVIKNKINSGRAFYQWKKGLEASTGDLVWIAESDDYCEPDFLEKLVGEFDDESIGIAYTVPIYVDSSGAPTEWNFEKYTYGISTGRWNQSYRARGEDEVAHAMGLRNTMVNASALIIRKKAIDAHIMENDWSEMSLCGDWLLYLKILAKYSVGFVKDAGSYFQQSLESSGYLSAREEKYTAEHLKVISFLEDKFRAISHNVIDANIDYMIAHWMAVNGGMLPEHVIKARYIRYGDHEKIKKKNLDFEKSLKHCHAQLNESKSENNRIVLEYNNCKAELAQLEKAHSSILKSRTWRYAAPIRNLCNKLKKVLQ